MSLVAAITDIGISEAESAQAGSFLITIDHAQFSGDLITPPTVTHLQSITFMTNVVYTAPHSQIEYHIVNPNTIMLRVTLPPNLGPFNFGSYALNLADGTPFAVGTWTSIQTKDTNSARYVELTIVFSNAVGTINLTLLNTIDAALPEVPDETQLPPPNSAPYPVYFVHQLLMYQNQPALASRYNNAWYYYPSKQSYYVVDTSSTPNIITATTTEPFTSLIQIKTAVYVKVQTTNTAAVTFNLDSLGAKPVINMDGSALVPGQIVVHAIIALHYDPGRDSFQILTPLARPSRVRLQAPLNLFVAPAPLGNDANDGLSLATPFLHPQTAWNYIVNNIDANGNSIQINMADGDYNSGIFAATMPLGSVLGLNIVGNYTTPSNCRVTVNSGDCFSFINGSSTQVDSMKLSATIIGGDYVGGGCAFGSAGGSTIYFRNIEFAYCISAHIDAEGGTVTSLGRNYSIVGNSNYHQISSVSGNSGTADSYVLIKGVITLQYGFIAAQYNSTNSSWNQVWGNSQILNVTVNNVGAGLTNGTRTFTAAGGYGTQSCTWTATVAGGSVVPGTEVITNSGNYSCFTAQPTATANIGVNTINFANTTGVYDGMKVGHLQIPPGTTVVSHTTTTVTLSNALTGVIAPAFGPGLVPDLVTFIGVPQTITGGVSVLQLEANPATVDIGSSNATFDLSLTIGPKFSVSTNSTIITHGASRKYLPGSTAGYEEVATGGHYT
jgi:Phage tail-collar fibre protein